jgi:hypothetical protein
VPLTILVLLLALALLYLQLAAWLLATLLLQGVLRLHPHHCCC